MGQVLVVTSGKGGTGKTTLCAGIASSLAKRGQQVLCIDGDIGLRNLDIALGMSDTATVSFIDVIEGRCALEDAPRHRAMTGLALLTAPVSAGDAACEGFDRLLRQARLQFSWVLIDAPAGIGSGFELATAFADRALVVSGADPASLRDAGRAAQLLRPTVQQIHLVVNRISRRLFRQIGATVDDMMDQIGLPLLGLVPEDPNVVLAAVSGVPLVQYTARGAAVAVDHIARRLMDEKVALMRIR